MKEFLDYWSLGALLILSLGIPVAGFVFIPKITFFVLLIIIVPFILGVSFDEDK